SKRNATDFSLLQLEGMPLEIQPVIDALNKLFERLDAEFTRNKRFASDAAHELRTPLAALKTQTQVALLTTDEQEKKKILKNIVLSVDRLTHVVHQLLTMSRLSKEDTIQNITQFDLAQLAAEVIAEIVPNALKKNINIELIKDRTPSIIEGNHVGLSILIRNLVDNAIRYSPENSFVKVILINHPSTVTLKVIDNGPGIPDELRERIFERFYRIPGTQEIGSGLGLSIVKQIVDLHHARIHLAKTNNCFEIDIVLHKKLP
ncbi:MAG: GHKL domain-containing protein, partial [Gammaproteobacteria bacterium]|nr:GHKL domain-containing protein [Gammaproteobacteria bacterium]